MVAADLAGVTTNAFCRHAGLPGRRKPAPLLSLCTKEEGKSRPPSQQSQHRPLERPTSQQAQLRIEPSKEPQRESFPSVTSSRSAPILPGSPTDQAIADAPNRCMAWTVANLSKELSAESQAPAAVTTSSRMHGLGAVQSRRRQGGVVVSMNGARILPPPSVPPGLRPAPPSSKPMGLNLEPIVTPLIPAAHASGSRAATPVQQVRRSSSSGLTIKGIGRHEEAKGQAMRRRVYFCPTPQNSSHVVTPYGKKYGMHPAFFDFDRRGEMQLTDAGVVDEMRQQEELERMI
jgi:hypothetical protein